MAVQYCFDISHLASQILSRSALSAFSYRMASILSLFLITVASVDKAIPYLLVILVFLTLHQTCSRVEHFTFRDKTFLFACDVPALDLLVQQGSTSATKTAGARKHRWCEQ